MYTNPNTYGKQNEWKVRRERRKWRTIADGLNNKKWERERGPNEKNGELKINKRKDRGNQKDGRRNGRKKARGCRSLRERQTDRQRKKERVRERRDPMASSSPYDDLPPRLADIDGQLQDHFRALQ